MTLKLLVQALVTLGPNPAVGMGVAYRHHRLQELLLILQPIECSEPILHQLPPLVPLQGKERAQTTRSSDQDAVVSHVSASLLVCKTDNYTDDTAGRHRGACGTRVYTIAPFVH